MIGMSFMKSLARSLAAIVVGLTVTSLLAGPANQTIRWDFDSEEPTPMTARGDVARDQIGPRPPEFPDLDPQNTAVRLGGNGARLEISDPGPESQFDFTNGDAITMEAWIKVDNLGPGQPAYVIGKGRTHSPRFSRNNQNWSLRVVGAQNGLAQLSFLFTSLSKSGEEHWHRWTSDAAFVTSTGWHHVAVAYEFGDSKTIRGWIDGVATDGKWDVDGPTTDPPVVDDDDVWIGSSLNGNPGNSFRGLLDMVAVHRTQLSDETIAKRFRREGGPQVITPAKQEMPELGEIAEGQVLVQFSEGLPDFKRWPHAVEQPSETSRWMTEQFLLPRVPQRFDSWGIRSAWKAPLLVRMAADVDLPPGEQWFLIRTRALARLWVDGQLVAETKPADASSPNGHELVTPLSKPPHPGERVKGYRQQEAFGTTTIGREGSRSRVVLELIAGGKNQRTETGEVCVAIESSDGDSFAVLRAGSEPGLPLTDAAIEPVLVQIESELAARDDAHRREAVRSRDAFWEQRHAIAKDWVAANPPPQPPRTGHPVDAFIDAKIDAAISSSTTASEKGKDFHEEVLPTLREACFRCHGEKEKGGLKLDSLAAAMKGGDSEIPALVPGDATASELLARIRTDDDSLVMPPSGDRLSKDQITKLENWIQQGAVWPAPPVDPKSVAKTPLASDEAFLRRIYLDIIGVTPTAEETRAFLADDAPDKREQLINELLADERWVDHQMSDWLDLFAENPTLINPSLNSTGPFRWFFYDAMRDGKAIDRTITELIMMRGDEAHGGSAGFAMAAENDSPFAAKGHIVASALMGIELQCARCHDSPYHSTTQRDLFSLAAMLSRKTVTVPKTSRVPAGFFEEKGRESLIQVTLKPDEPVAAEWPFAARTGVADGPNIDALVENPKDTRERFAALVTSPENRLFSQVIVNRLWVRLMGAGLVEPVHDWEGRDASHPELLDWLAGEFIANDYDLKHVIRLITTSDAYQREPGVTDSAGVAAEDRYFNSPVRRRLSAEQIVDSLHASTGKPIDSEELTFVHDGRHPLGRRQTLGTPNRAWMFASLNNERDRPSLALPHAQTTVDVLEAFGWNGSRQMPIFERDTEPNVLQPGIMANGTLVQSLSRASLGSDLAARAVNAESPEALLETLFLQFLNRMPRETEVAVLLPALQHGFDKRLVPDNEQAAPNADEPLPLATWLNHVTPEANNIQLEVEKRVRRGPHADPRLRSEWREVYEDIIWSLINDREFVWIP